MREGRTKVTDWRRIIIIKSDLLIPISRRIPLSKFFFSVVIFSNE